MYNSNDYQTGYNRQAYTTSVTSATSAVLKNVYAWMAGALAITAIVAYGVSISTAALQLIFGNQLVFWGLMIAELALVFILSARIMKLEFSTAMLMFGAYSVLNGINMASLFLIYTGESIVTTFGVCAATFGAMAFIGHTTKTDMTSWGKYFIMALIGLVIATLVNMFVQNQGFSLLLSYLGVFLFIGLTAYDAQKIKNMVEGNINAGTDVMQRIALLGALSLYLDFINLFLYLLRIMGNRRD